MFDIQRYIYKFKQAVNVDEVVKILEKLPQDSAPTNFTECWFGGGSYQCWG